MRNYVPARLLDLFEATAWRRTPKSEYENTFVYQHKILPIEVAIVDRTDNHVDDVVYHHVDNPEEVSVVLLDNDEVIPPYPLRRKIKAVVYTTDKSSDDSFYVEVKARVNNNTQINMPQGIKISHLSETIAYETTTQLSLDFDSMLRGIQSYQPTVTKEDLIKTGWASRQEHTATKFWHLKLTLKYHEAVESLNRVIEVIKDNQ